MRRRRDQDALELLVAALVLYRLAVRQEVSRRVRGIVARARASVGGDPTGYATVEEWCEAIGRAAGSPQCRRRDPSRARPAPLGSGA